MAKVKVHDRVDRLKLKAALVAAGHVDTSITAGTDGVFAEVADDEALEVDRFAQRFYRRSLVQAVRDAPTLQPELKEAVASALEEVFGL